MDVEHEITVIILAVAIIAFLGLADADARTWLAIRRQRDRTDVGVWLKRKKLAWAAVATALAVLYTMTLLDELDWYDVGIWPRLTVRMLTLAAVVVAAVTGRRFRRAYERENWGLPERR